MERHHRDLLTAFAAILVCLFGVLGWDVWSRAHQEPPMVVAGTNGRAPTGAPAPAGKPDPTAQSPLSASPTAAPVPARKPATLRIHVVGAVRKPAVYALAPDSRVTDAVDKAGGATTDADLERINLADFLKDGEQVRIPRMSERTVSALARPASHTLPVEPRSAHRPVAAAHAASSPAGGYHRPGRYPGTIAAEGAPAAGAPAAAPSAMAPNPSASSPPNGKINLNTATAAELDDLPGVGPATAAKILAHRKEHGPFLKIEDIQDVRGIGPKKFEQMKDRLTVK